MTGSSVFVLSDRWLRISASTLIAWMPTSSAVDRGALVTGRILEAAGLPPFLETVMRPWVAAVENGTLGMRDEVAVAASSTAASLKRRVVISSALDMAIAEAVATSVTFSDTLGTRGTKPAQTRAAALASLVAVIENLRTAEPSEDTRAIGLGW